MDNQKYHFSKEEFEKITSLLERKPSSIEQALFSALWSEHCSYKSSKIHLKKFPHSSPRVVTRLGENAGVIDLGKKEKVAFKMESHNHPSRIVPFHGAMTGVGGILRDIFTMNARPIALAHYLCFGEENYPITSALVDGVVRGIGGYGNCIGLPMVTGKTEFHSSYNENILVNAFALGVYEPQDSILTSQLKDVGAFVVYVGSRTGRDGIHGASMASESFGEGKKKQSTVQVGDPFFGKLLMEACLEAMKKNLVLSAQDMGAAGLTSSSFEMASKGNLGMTLHLDQVPLRDETMNSEEILLSETQERMLLICSPEKYPDLEKVFRKWKLPIRMIGEVISERQIQLFWKKEKICSIDPHLLTEKAPQLERAYEKWKFPNQVFQKEKTLSQVSDSKNTLLQILKSSEGRSRKPWYSQYDQRVGVRTAWDCSDPIGIIQLPSKRFLSISLGARPHLLEKDAFIGACDSIFYPSLELMSRGFEPLACTDCLNFGNPEKKEIMSQFVACVEGIAQACKSLSIPVISGNVSFYNEFLNQNITPTPATGLVGLRDDEKWSPHFFEKEGHNIYLIYEHQCWVNSFKNCFYGEIIFKSMSEWIQKIKILSGKGVTSSRVVGRWGIASTLSQMMIPRGCGAVVTCDLDPFQERLYELIMTTSKENASAFEASLKELNLRFMKIGYTQGTLFDFKNLLTVPVSEIRDSFYETTV